METAAPALVQALADAGISHLPAQYVQPPEHRPATSSSHGAAALYVPVVDLSSASAANAVCAACADWGAFHVVGHGVPGELLDAMRRAGLAFFRAPMEGKFRFACDPARGAAAEGFGHTAAVCSPMTTPCSIGATTSTITLCRSPDATPPSGRISSLVTVTLLIQDDVAGLEVMKDGMWIPVPPLPDAILVILADQAEILTNARYKRSVHRAVVNAEHAGLSVATFYDPSKSRKISTTPLLVRGDEPQKYRDVVYGDYVSSWYSKGPEGKRNINALLIQQ